MVGFSSVIGRFCPISGSFKKESMRKQGFGVAFQKKHRKDAVLKIGCSLRALVVVSALSLATFIQNGYVYPPVLRIYPFAAALFSLFFALGFALWALVAHRNSKPLPTTTISLFSILALVCGGTLWLPGESYGYPFFSVMCSIALMSMARAWAVIMVGLSLTKLPPPAIVVVVLSGVCLAYLYSLVLSPFLKEIASLLYIALPVASLLLVMKSVHILRVSTLKLTSAPMKLAITNPESFLEPNNRLFICILLFEMAFGISIRFDASSDSLWQSLITGSVLSLIALWCILYRHSSREDTLFYLSSLLVLGGFSLSSTQVLPLQIASQELLAIGSQTFNVLTWSVCIIVASRNPIGGISVLGQGFCASSIGATIGVIGKNVVFDHAMVSEEIRFIIISCIVTGFIAYVWIALKQHSFSATIQGIKPLSSLTIPPTEAGIKTSCEHLAQLHGLTVREKELFMLLARGRNGTYIQQQCHITRNTAKTHIRHIYEKLHVHTHQELLDLIETHGEAKH